jgi:hypothetical protein
MGSTSRSKELLRILLNNGITPDSQALFLALQQTLNDQPGDTDILDSLIKAGANMKARDTYGNSLLQFAQQWDNQHSKRVINLLKSAGATG